MAAQEKLISRESKMQGKAGKLILASRSPRRQKLLKEAGYEFEVVPPAAFELPLEGSAPRRLAEQNALCKARDVASKVQSAIVLAADTVVSLGGKSLGKPQDTQDAYRILSLLSGTRHSVITAVALVEVGSGKEVVFSEETFIVMRKVPEEILRWYTQSGQSMGKAGAYAIQKVGDKFIEKIEGSFSNAVGLPMERISQVLDHYLQKTSTPEKEQGA